MTKLEIQSGDARAALGRIIQACADTTPLMRDLAAVMHDQTEENFARESGPLGAWPALKDPKRKGGKILQKSGRLAASFSGSYGKDWSQLGTNVIYAAIQHFGGTIEKPAQSRQVRHRTDAKGNLIRTEQFHGKGLIFAKDSHKRAMTRWFEQPAYTIKIPARPAMPVTTGVVQPEFSRSILATMNAYFQKYAQTG